MNTEKLNQHGKTKEIENDKNEGKHENKKLKAKTKTNIQKDPWKMVANYGAN